MSEVQFLLEIDQFVEEAVPKQVVALQKAITEYAFRRLYKITPRDTEDTAHRWKVSVGTETADDSYSSSPIGDAMAAIRTIKPFDDIYIVNNSEVATILEFGLFEPPNPGPSKDPRPERFGKILVEDGFSTQAPNGMLTTVEAEVNEFF